ncbi:MAG: hypothetical protein HKN93_02150 [Acidimicrobiia bacterium]|nr:hypothetical protein [Acidimicrobiia bacterium]
MAEVPRLAGNLVAIAAAGLTYVIASARINSAVAALAAFLVLGFNTTWLVSNDIGAGTVFGLFLAWVALALLAWAASRFRDESRRVT